MIAVVVAIIGFLFGDKISHLHIYIQSSFFDRFFWILALGWSAFLAAYAPQLDTKWFAPKAEVNEHE